MTQTAYQKPELYVDCPVCGEGSFAVGRLPLGEHRGPWMCDECGAWIAFEQREGNVFDVTDTGRRGERRFVVLQSEGPVRLLVSVHHEPEYLTDEHNAFLYNEHTCPTNYLPDVAEVIDPLTGRIDPHGIFKYVRTIQWVDTDEEALPPGALA